MIPSKRTKYVSHRETPFLVAKRKVSVIPITEALKSQALNIAQTLRAAGIAVEFEVMGRKMAKALEDADKRKVDFAVIVGERELKEGAVVLKDLVNRQQNTTAIEKLVEKIKS